MIGIVHSVRDPRNNRYALAATVKRTYRLRPGRLTLAGEQAPIVSEPVLERVTGNDYRTLLDDIDLVAEKPKTDVVVLGSAHARARVKELHVAVAVSGFARRLRVTGERRAEVSADGKVRFTSPEPFERLSLSDIHAYGGYDRYAHDKLQPAPVPAGPPRTIAPGLVVDAPAPRHRGLYGYARNGSGRAFFIDLDRERANGAALPLIEDPSDALTPERLFVPTVRAWVDAPISATLGWLHHASYPRIARLCGPVLAHDEPSRPIRETLLGDGEDLLDMPRPLNGKITPKALQGASPGLARERLRGDEPVVLENLHREHAELGFQLPGEVPKITLRPVGLKAFEPRPVLQTLRIEPDLDRVSLTWSAFVPMMGPVDAQFCAETKLSVDFH